MSTPPVLQPSTSASTEEFVCPTPFTGAWGNTLVIYCTDPRFRRQTHEFLHDHLALEHPAVITVPGSASTLLPLVGFAHKLVKGWIDLLLGKHRPERIICIAHEDCAAYGTADKHHILNLMVQHVTGGSVADLQRKHLKDTKTTLTTWFPGIQVEVYFAKITDIDGSRRVVFTKVA